jgi:hypothetical protein
MNAVSMTKAGGSYLKSIMQANTSMGRTTIAARPDVEL